MVSILKSAWQRVTLTRLATLSVLLPLAWFVFEETARPVVIIDSFEVPKQYEESGFTSSVFTKRVRDALRSMQTEAQKAQDVEIYGTHGYSLALASDPNTLPDFEVLSAKLSLRSLVQFIQEAFDREPRIIAGDVTFRWSGKSKTGRLPEEEGTNGTKLNFRVTKGRAVLAVVEFPALSSDPDSVVQELASAIMHNVDPYLFAVYTCRSNPDAAIKVAKEIISKPENGARAKAQAYNLWGLCASKQGSSGVEQFKAATKVDQSFAGAHNSLGNVLYTQGNLKEAEVEYRKATVLEPGWVTPKVNLAAVLADEGDLEGAAAECRKAIHLDKTGPAAYVVLGHVLHRQGQFDAAISEYQEALVYFPRFAAAYAGWGQALYAQNRLGEATSKFGEALRLDPMLEGDAQVGWFYRNYAEALEKMGRKKEAEEVRRKQKAVEGAASCQPTSICE